MACLGEAAKPEHVFLGTALSQVSRETGSNARGPDLMIGPSTLPNQGSLDQRFSKRQRVITLTATVVVPSATGVGTPAS